MEHLGVDHVAGRHAAAEDHGDEHQDGQEVVQPVLRAAEHVAHQGGEQHAQRRADNRDIDGNPQGVEDGLPLAPQVLVGVTGEGFGRDPYLIAYRADDVIIRDGDHEDENDGQEAGQGHDQEHQVEQEVGYRADPVEAAEGIAADRLNFFTHVAASIKSERWTGRPCARWRWPTGW